MNFYKSSMGRSFAELALSGSPVAAGRSALAALCLGGVYVAPVVARAMSAAGDGPCGRALVNFCKSLQNPLVL